MKSNMEKPLILYVWLKLVTLSSNGHLIGIVFKTGYLFYTCRV